MENRITKNMLFAAIAVMVSSCGAYYADEVQPPSGQELQSAREMAPSGALRDGVFHMQRVDEGSTVRVQDQIALKRPNLPMFDVAYISRNVESVILELANAAGESIVVPQGLRNRTVTVVHSGANFKEMLDIVLGKVGYHYNYVDGVWYITRYPVRSYVLEIGQSNRRGSLISSAELAPEQGENATTSSASEQLDTQYVDELWDQVEKTLEDLVEVGQLDASKGSIPSAGMNSAGRILPSQTNRSQVGTVQFSQDENSVSNDVLGGLTRNGGLTPASIAPIPSTDHLQPEEDAHPWYKITRSAGLITVRAAPEAHRLVEEYLERVHDTALKQVYIEVRIVAVTHDKTSNRGANFSASVGDSVLSNIGFQSTAPLTGTAATGAFLNTFLTSTGGAKDMDFVMQALSTIGNVYSISSPSMLARNNQLSRVSLTRQLGYAETEVDQNTTTTGEIVIGSRVDQVRFKNSGTVLSVLPYIGKSRVQMRLRLSVASKSGETAVRTSVGTEDPIVNLVPELSTNVVDQDMVLEYGRVYAIGGLIENNVSTNRDYIPGISDLPGFKELMSHSKNVQETTEFIVFLRVSRS